MELQFFRCKHCGNIITHLNNSGVNVVCCGEPMELLTPNTNDGAGEKHVPAVTREGNMVTVRVGSVEHPSVENHYIMWIALQTRKGVQVHYLKPGETPASQFLLAPGDEAVAAYEYCNLHGLWMTSL
ncbi:MAG: desulfoferrodoxin FeS4 iron-binding domain-containing protein [Bacteroidales bacterium]|jgi:superoxide reductase|nr:desulfoferrodoxin FeS4 iron-binding domain-containing protein [Bacteroidales bacterium]